MENVIHPLALELELPWKPLAEQEAKFKQWGKRAAIALLVFFITIPWLPVFEAELETPITKLVKTKVILEKKPLPQPIVKPSPTPVPKPKALKKEPPKPPKKNENLAKAKPKLGNAKAKPSNKKPVNTKAAVAKRQGLAKVTSELSALRGALNVAGMKRQKITSKKAGMVATVSHKVLGENRSSRASTGISVSDNMMKGDTTQLKAHESTQVDGVIAEGVADGSSQYTSYQSGQRDIESVRRTIEAKKGAIYALYNRALDEHPELNGKFVFNMVILPNGKISGLKLVSSELALHRLESEMLNRIAMIDFGVADVSATQVEYKFVFIPS